MGECEIKMKSKDKERDQTVEITIKDLLTWVMRGIVLILVTAILFGSVAFVYTKYFVAPTYEAEVKFYASSSAENKNQLLAEYYRSVAPQYIEFLNVTEFYEMLSKKLQEETEQILTPKQISSCIRFSSIIADTSSFFVLVKTTDANLTYQIAKAIAELAPERISNFENVGALEVLSNPRMPVSPSGPSLSRNVLLGVILGLVLSAGFVIIKEITDNRIRTAEEIGEFFGLPVFGSVPDFSANEKKGGR